MLAAAGTRLASAGPPDAPVIAHTSSGGLRGAVADDANIFRRVPFAQPPIGPLRFRAPRPVQPWSGIRDATQFATAAVQPDTPGFLQSEDCLYVNICTPRTPGPHPVFVWIHGGGFTGGRSFDPMFDGTTFAQQGIICITIAYRLGVFGFLDLDAALGPLYAGSANNALRDIMLALTWIQQNVAAFGGDPTRITIGGESAGAKLTDILMGIPSATPLFQQMISESGGAERIWPAARATIIASNFCAQWTASSGQPDSVLKYAAAHEIVAAQRQFTGASPVHFPLRPEIDGSLIRQHPVENIRQGSARGKRLLIGTDLDESALFIGPHPAKDPDSDDLGNMPVEQFRPIEEEYRKIYPGLSDQMLRIRSLTAEEYGIPSLRVADAQASAGGTVYAYRFDYAQQSGRFTGLAFHSSELRFVWDHMMQPTVSTETLQLAATIHDAWCSFIRGEAPQAAGLPPWPPYSIQSRPTMILDRSSRVENKPQDAEIKAWSGLLMQ